MEKLIKVINRNMGSTGYIIPDTGVRRYFESGESKNIPLEELKQLQWVPGGEYILKNCLIVNDKDALTALNLDVEPEYFYTEKEIKELLEEGTLDQLEDCLNFAPKGVIELIKDIAIKTELPDTRKRKLISEKTGFNIDNAINVNTIMNADDEQPKEEKKVVRKATPIKTAAAAPVRKATPVATSSTASKIVKTTK